MEDNGNQTSDWLSNVMRQLGKHISSSSNETLEATVEEIVDDLLEEAVLEIVFDEHKSAKGCLSLQRISDEDIKTFAIVESSDGDIFGQNFVKKPSICRCPRCQRPLGASLFTTHLQNCVGKGRSSARIASLRIANNCIRNAYGGGSDEDDDDWISGPEKGKKRKIVETKKSQDKSNIRRGKNQNKKKSTKDVIHGENNDDI